LKKTILIVIGLLFLCSSLSFAASGTSSTDAYSDNQKLYEFPQSSSLPYHVSTDLRFTQKSEVSTTATVLSSGTGDGLIGDTICPGTVTVKSTSSGKWADNDFYARVYYYYSCAPTGSSTTPTDVAIRFHNSDYNILKNVYVCHDYDSCYGHEGTLTNRKIDIYELYPNSADYTNRLGRVSYTCAASNSLSVTGAGSFSVQQATGSTSFSTTRSVNLNKNGTYTFTDKMSVSGCAAVVRYPSCSTAPYEDERIFSRTSASLTSASEYSKTATNTFTIKVEDRQNSIKFGSTTPSSPVTIPNSTTPTLVGISVTNNGGAIVQITAVTSNNSMVKVEAFDNSLCSGPVPSSISAICSGGGGGFNTNINPGATRTVYVYLSAPTASAPGTYQTTLTFTHVAQSNVCDSKTDTTGFELNKGSGPGNPTRCEITPSTESVKLQQLYDFTVACYDSTNAKVSCSGSNWNLVGLSGVFFSKTSSSAQMFTTSSVGSTGQLRYTTGSVSCDSNLTVTDFTEGLTVTPPTAKLKQNDTQQFTATCTQNGNPVTCLGNQWNPKGGLIGKLSNSTINTTIYTATVDNVTTRLYSVAYGLNSVNPPVGWADITVGSGSNGDKNETDDGDDNERKGKSKYCVIDPDSQTVYTGWRTWTVTCLDPGNGQPTSCKKTVAWYLNGVPLPSNSITGMITNALITMPGTTQTLIAYTDEAANQKCILDFNSTAYDCILYS